MQRLVDDYNKFNCIVTSKNRRRKNIAKSSTHALQQIKCKLKKIERVCMPKKENRTTTRFNVESENIEWNFNFSEKQKCIALVLTLNSTAILQTIPSRCYSPEPLSCHTHTHEHSHKSLRFVFLLFNFKTHNLHNEHFDYIICSNILSD